MDVLAWLLTLSNLQTFGGPDRQVKDVSVLVGQLPDLTNEFKNDKDFDIADFQDTYYKRIDNIGMLLTRNLHDYMFKRKVDPTQEGAIIIVLFESVDPSAVKYNGEDLESITYLIQRKEHPEKQIATS